MASIASAAPATREMRFGIWCPSAFFSAPTGAVR
jgi:hypothetical protein